MLQKADELDVLGVLESSSDKVLPLVAKAIDLSPSLLPLASFAIKTPPTTLTAGALASLVTAAGLIYIIPDDSVTTVALQAFLGVPLGVVLPGALVVGSVVLSKLSK